MEKEIHGLIAAFLVVAIALTFTGCSKADQPPSGEASSAGDETAVSQMEETGAGSEAPVLEGSDSSPAEDTPQEPESSPAEAGSEEAEDEPQAAGAAAIDIWDYIDGNEWDYYGMAADLGWQREDYELDVLGNSIVYARVTRNCPDGVPAVLDPNSEAHRNIKIFNIDCGDGVSEKCDALFPSGQEVRFTGVAPEKCYTVMGRTDGLRVPLEEIVVTAIYLERLSVDSENDAADMLQTGNDLLEALTAAGAVHEGGGVFTMSCQ